MTPASYVELESRAKSALDEETYKRLLPIVRRTVMRLTVDSQGLEFSELGTWAWRGVLEAAERDDGEMDETEIESYAVFRARSALLDALTAKDPKQTLARDLSARVACAIRVLRAQTGKEPTSRAIAAELGMSDDTYALALDEIAETGSSRIEVLSGGACASPLEIAAQRKPDAASAIAEALPLLPEIQQAIFELHYGERFSMSDVAEHIGVSVGEVRRLHTEAIQRLRASLG